MKHRINFRNWRLFDVDNYMGGNPFFSDVLQQADWENKLEDKMGSKDNFIETIRSEDQIEKEF